MKIDWKALSKTNAYRSLKAAYIRDVTSAGRSKRPLRDKAEFLRHFRWVIGRAQHYAHHQNRPIETILTIWESNRNYWWLNYYQNCNQPKSYPEIRKSTTRREKSQ